MLLTGMQNNFLSLLRELINIQSVSADPKRVEFIIKAAELISKKLKSLGFDIKIYRPGNSSGYYTNTYARLFQKRYSMSVMNMKCLELIPVTINKNLTISKNSVNIKQQEFYFLCLI